MPPARSTCRDQARAAPQTDRSSTTPEESGIKTAQELGFTLTEIEELLRLRSDQTASCLDVRATGQAKIKDIEQKIRSLRAMKRALGVLVSSCTSDGSTRECPILEALDETGVKGRKS